MPICSARRLDREHGARGPGLVQSEKQANILDATDNFTKIAEDVFIAEVKTCIPSARSMRRDPRVYLLDALTAGELIRSFLAARSLEDYEKDAMLRSAVERQFEVVGV